MNHFWGQNLPPSAVNASTDRTNDGWDSYRHYSTYPGPTPNNSYNNQHKQQHGSTSTSNSVWNIPGNSSHNWHSSEPVAEEDQDGLPYEPDEEDPELTRKRKELQVIQEQIMLKRASLALKTVDVKTYRPGLCTEGSKPIEPSETLRGRVKLILRLRDRVLRTNGPVAASRRSSFHVQHDHPMRRRVAAALQQRFVSPPVEPHECEPIPFLSCPSPRPKEPSPVKEEVNKSDQGFMRFLNILNKGVDIDKLTEIVNDDTGRLPHSSQNGVEIHGAISLSKSPPIERKRLEERRPSTDEQQKHLQNILESLGLSLGTDEINRLGDRTQERLYGKKQSPEEEKTQTEQQQKGGEEKYSPAHYTRSSSSCESSSSSSRSPSRTPSPCRRRRSPSPARSRRRSSWSPRRSRHSHSPYRRRNSRSPHRRTSPHPRDRQDSHLRYISPMQPYPYLPSQYFSPHFPPQMYPNAYCYSQYTAYYNYWAYNQASVAGPTESSNLKYPQNIPPLLPGLQAPRKSKEKQTKTPNETNDKNTRCLVAVNQMSMSETHQKAQMNKRNKAQRKQLSRYRKSRASEKVEKEQDKVKDWTTELNAVIAAIKTETYPTAGETTGASAAQGTSGTQQNPTDATGPRKRKKKKKKLYFIERNEQMEKLLDNRPGPLTRALGLKNPAKLSEYGQKLVEIEDVEAPSQDFWDDIPLNVPVEMTDTEDAGGVAEEKKPELTEEEVKANLKKVLQAFNSRMKKNVTQPAGLLMPQNIKVEDEI